MRAGEWILDIKHGGIDGLEAILKHYGTRILGAVSHLDRNKQMEQICKALAILIRKSKTYRDEDPESFIITHLAQGLGVTPFQLKTAQGPNMQLRMREEVMLKLALTDAAAVRRRRRFRLLDVTLFFLAFVALVSLGIYFAATR